MGPGPTSDAPQLPPGTVSRYHILGFRNAAMNTVYSISNTLVSGRQTYWSPEQDFFMYFQADKQKWHISPRSGPPEQPGESDMDLLEEARRGGNRGFAIQVEETAWREYVDGSWHLKDLQIGFDMGDGEFTYTEAPPTAGMAELSWQHPGLQGQLYAMPGTPAAGWAAPDVGSRIPATPRDAFLAKIGMAPAPGTPSRIPQTPMHAGVWGAEAPAQEVSAATAAKILSLPERFLPEELKVPPPKRRKVNEEPTLFNFGKPPEKYPVWVGFFPETVTLDDVAAFFGGCGPIMDKVQQGGQAVVHFNSSEDQLAALERGGGFLGGAQVEVRLQQNFEREPEAGGNGCLGWEGSQQGSQSDSWECSWGSAGHGSGWHQNGGWSSSRGDSQSAREDTDWGQDGWDNQQNDRTWRQNAKQSWGESSARSWEEASGKDWVGWTAAKTDSTGGGWTSHAGQSGSSSWTDGGKPGGSPNGQGQQSSEKMDIPRHLVGLVVGQGGQTIKRLQEQSGAKIKLEGNARDAPPSEPCFANLSGPPECINKAKSLVQEILDAGARRDAGKSKGLGKGGGRALLGSSAGAAQSPEPTLASTAGSLEATPKPGLLGLAATRTPAAEVGGRAFREALAMDLNVGIGMPGPTKGKVGGKGTGGGDGMSKGASNERGKGKGKNLPTDSMEIQPKLAAAVSRGVAKLQEQSGARIKLKGNTQANGSSQPCLVCFSGTFESISQAKRLVQELVDTEESSLHNGLGKGCIRPVGSAVSASSGVHHIATGSKGTDTAMEMAVATTEDEFDRLCAEAAPDATGASLSASTGADEFERLCAEVAAEAPPGTLEDEFDRLCAAAMTDVAPGSVSTAAVPGASDEFDRLWAEATTEAESSAALPECAAAVEEGAADADAEDLGGGHAEAAEVQALPLAQVPSEEA